MIDAAWTRDPFVQEGLTTTVIRAEDLKSRPFTFGVTLYVYRVVVNGTQRTLPPARPDRRRPLPVDVSFVISTWAASAERELELLGWCMRVIDDNPILAAADLNRAVPEVYGPTETVEILADPLSLEEHHRLWDVLPWDYQLSAAYTARTVRLESWREHDVSGPVLERELALASQGAHP